MGAAVRPGDAEIGEQQGGGLGFHGAASPADVDHGKSTPLQSRPSEVSERSD
jgi:hypothetical protein